MATYNPLQLLKDRLQNDPELYKDVARTLGGGGSGMSAGWYKVAIELSRLPRFHGKINLDFMHDIEAEHQNGPNRARLFLERIMGHEFGCTCGEFCTGLRGALLERLADLVDGGAGQATQSRGGRWW
jgi:hypothetical protein